MNEQIENNLTMLDMFKHADADGILHGEFAVRLDRKKAIWSYVDPQFSFSGGLCNFGCVVSRIPGIGEWVESERIEVVEVINKEKK